MTDINVFHRNAAGAASDWLTDWSGISATLRRNYVGSWELTLPGWVDFAPDEGIVVERDGLSLFSGCWTEIEHHFDGFTWSTRLIGDTDLARIAYRVVYTNPANGWADQDATHHTVTTQGAEAVMRALVNLNAGPGANAPRQVSGLVLGAVGAVGSAISKEWRFTPLLDALRTAARLGGGLTFDVRQAASGTDFEFTVAEPRDRTAAVHIEPGMPGVETVTHELIAPVATAYELAGSGAGIDRKTREVIDTAAEALGWARREMFVDRRDTETNAELDNEAADRMVDNGPTVSVGAVITSAPGLAFGIDWLLGDRVSVHTPAGPMTSIVETVEYAYEVDGREEITAAIGVARLLSQPEWLPIIIDKEKRIQQMEAGL